jgi:replication factor A1
VHVVFVCLRLAPEDTAIKHVQYSFVPITSLETAVKDTTVDILGVIKDVTAPHSFTSKAGKDLVKREVTLVDASATSVALTLWGSSTEAITEASVGNILAVKSARVGEFGGGKSLSSSQSSVLTENPDLPEARKLREWWDTQGSTAAVTTLSSSGGGGGGTGGTGPTNNVAARKTFAAVKSEGLGASEAGDVFTVKGTINYIKSDGDRPPWYPACITPNCNKKAVQAMTGPGWHCEKVCVLLSLIAVCMLRVVTEPSSLP